MEKNLCIVKFEYIIHYVQLLANTNLFYAIRSEVFIYSW